MRDDLDRLAETHVVGEHAPEPQADHGLEPAEAVELIGAQLRRETGGSGEFLALEPIELGHKSLKAPIAPYLERPRPVEERIERKGAVPRHAKLPCREPVHLDAERIRKPRGLARLRADADDVATREAREPLPASICLEIGLEIGGFKAARVDLDVEQVVLDRGTHAQARGVAHRHVAQALAQAHLAELGERGQALGLEQIETLGVVLVEMRAHPADRKPPLHHVLRAELGRERAGRGLGHHRASLEKIRLPCTVGNPGLAVDLAVVGADREREPWLGSGRGATSLHQRPLVHAWQQRAAGIVQIAQGERQLMDAHHLALPGRGAAALVVDDLVLAQIELAGDLQALARVFDAPAEHHDIAERAGRCLIAHDAAPAGKALGRRIRTVFRARLQAFQQKRRH